MLTTSYNLSLSFCQLALDLVSQLLILHSFCSHGNEFAFSRCSYNSSAKMPVSNFQIKGRQVIGLKFDTKFPFWISFMQSKVFPVTIHLGKLFSWRHLSDWSAILLCKLLKFLIQYGALHTIGPWLFPVRRFYLLSFWILIRMSSCTVSSPSSFSTFLNQSVFPLYVTAWSQILL